MDSLELLFSMRIKLGLAMASRLSTVLICGITAVAFAQIASAADLPRKAPAYAPPPVPVYNWSGFYIGAQAGGAWSDSSYTFTNVVGPENFSHDPASFIGGGHIGAQYQWNVLVLGIEGTFSWMQLDDTQTGVLQPGRLRTLELNNMATVVGKIGYAAGQWMPYIKGGWATTKIETFSINPATGISGGTSDWESGWTVGGGVDYMFTPNWIAGIDFNYYRFDFDGRGGIATDGTPFSYTNTESKIFSVMARLSYKFDTGWR
jgi:outer membrane immunogenic protein